MGIKIKGKMTKDYFDESREVEIELDPKEQYKAFGEEDWILVKMKGSRWINYCHPSNEEVVYIFPQEKQKAELPAKFEYNEINAFKHAVDKLNQLIDVIKEMKKKE